MKKIILLLLISLTITSYAQDGSIDNSFNPPSGATNGDVLAISKQTDGKTIIGGNFTILNGIDCKKIGRLNIDGTVDPTFNIGSGFNNTVNSIKIQPDGKILIVGNFTAYNDVTVNRIVRLNTDGTIDTTFNIGAGANNNVYSTTIQTDGKIIVVGNFNIFDSSNAPRIVRLNVDGTVDSTFNITGTGVNNRINSCIVQADGKIIIAGIFTSFSGIANVRVVRLNIDGSFDNTFNYSNTINGSLPINTMVLQTDGKIIIGGQFSSYSNIPVNNIVRLNLDSTVDTTFNYTQGVSLVVNAIQIQSDGKLLVGGAFSNSSKGISRLNENGTIDTTFTGSTNNATVNAISIQSNNKILVGGNFSLFYNFSRNNIASINLNGNIDTSFFPFLGNGGISSDGPVRAIGLQTDGKIIIGGDVFSSYNNVLKSNLARLNSDGTLDETFASLGVNSYVDKISILSNNKIIIVGNFTTCDGVTRNRIAQLNSDGTLDTSFNASANDFIRSVSVQANGKILIGGTFNSVNGQATNRLVRLNSDGTLDNTFNCGIILGGSDFSSAKIQPDGKILICGQFNKGIARLNSNGSLDTTFNVGGVGANYTVSCISIQTDGKIIIGGFFDYFNNIPVNRLIRLNTNGSVDTSFNTNTPNNGVVYTCAIQNDGKIIVGGNIMRLNTDGTLDSTFITGTGFNSYISELVIQSDGKIIAGGGFIQYNGIEKKYIARLNNNSTNLGTENFTTNLKLNLYPNPVTDFLNFSIPNDANLISFDVYDYTGKKMESNILCKSVIDVQNYAKGIYLIQLTTDIGVFVSKFIKN